MFLNMNTQFLTDANGNKTGVLISISQYKKMMEELEELEDIKTFDKAKKRNEKTIPLREAIQSRKKKLKNG